MNSLKSIVNNILNEDSAMRQDSLYNKINNISEQLIRYHNELDLVSRNYKKSFLKTELNILDDTTSELRDIIHELGNLTNSMYSKHLDENVKLTESQVSFWTSPKSEDRLTELGFTIPQRPKQGDVMYNGEKIGYMSSFNGLVFTKEFSEANRDWLKDIANQIGVAMWNNL